MKMKKCICGILAPVLALGMLAGCGGSPAEPTATTAAATVPATRPAETTEPVSQQDSIREEARMRVGEAVELARNTVLEHPDRKGSTVTAPFDRGTPPRYDGLSENQKALYREILAHAEAFEPLVYSDRDCSAATLDDAMLASAALAEDRQELSMYCSLSEVIDASLEGTTLELQYFMPGDPDTNPVEDFDALRREIAVFDAACDLIVEQMPEHLTAYDRYRYLSAVLSFQTIYDEDRSEGWQVSGIYGAIITGSAVCEGYARSLRYLCKKADLRCDLVFGVGGGEGHAWNLVELEDGTYHVDVTWMDYSGAMPWELRWYDYFMVTQEQIVLDHEIQDGTVATGTGLFDPPI